ncbi:M-phase phosphoprotein 6 [Lamellibrachia satsuma]|nr:M-phase phosphoprotein 6 [Lamellibrachia satsuma]
MIACDNMAAESRETKTTLSRNLLGMKFMQRSAARKEYEKNELKQRIIDDEHWVIDIPTLEKDESQYVIESSYAKLNSLQFGRQSYQRFNPEIEKLMQSNNVEKGLADAEEREQEMGVSDDEMTERYSSLVGTISKKFAKKRKSDGQCNTSQDGDGNASAKKTKKKRKKQFMKPTDD